MAPPLIVLRRNAGPIIGGHTSVARNKKRDSAGDAIALIIGGLLLFVRRAFRPSRAFTAIRTTFRARRAKFFHGNLTVIVLVESLE